MLDTVKVTTAAANLINSNKKIKGGVGLFCENSRLLTGDENEEEPSISMLLIFLTTRELYSSWGK